jgi:hypothetical protein
VDANIRPTSGQYPDWFASGLMAFCSPALEKRKNLATIEELCILTFVKVEITPVNGETDQIYTSLLHGSLWGSEWLHCFQPAPPRRTTVCYQTSSLMASAARPAR